jgi:hypothetical protein
MAFFFKVHPTATGDAARVAYYLPELPAGVSWKLKEYIAKYTVAVINGPDGAEDEAYMAIKAFEADGLPDVITKVVYQLHFNRRGLSDDGELVITESSDASTAEIEFAAVVLDALYAQLPRQWSDAYLAWSQALAAETAYDQAFWTPAFQRHEAGGPQIPPNVDANIERLQRVRIDAEGVLIEMPAPSLTEFALKCAIALSDPDTGDALLCADAQRLLGMEVMTEDYTAARRAAAAWIDARISVAPVPSETKEV